MGGPGGHHAQCDKPDKYCMILVCEGPELVEVVEAESRMVGASSWVAGTWVFSCQAHMSLDHQPNPCLIPQS